MNTPSPSRLVIPNSGSPSSTGNMPTGRPPLWTNSSQRKMVRLYLYTTLPIEKILEVVHYPGSSRSIPGKDSANKKLNVLLDKEPRWLKPRNMQDMMRRCEQLNQSPTRTNAIPWPSPFTRNHSQSAPPPFAQGSTTPIKQERDAQSATLEVPPWQYSPVASFPSTPQAAMSGFGYQNYSSVHGRTVSDEIGGPSVTSRLMRKSSAMSISSDHSTGSFHRILEGYPEPFVQSVKKLVKQFTAPVGGLEIAMSPLSETMRCEPHWVQDPERPSNFVNRPFPLPGDFLSMDIHPQRRQHCFPESEEHIRRWCMCHAHCEVPESLWVSSAGPSDYGMQLLESGPSPNHADVRDCFGNTMLHFIAARGVQSLLLHAVSLKYVEPLLNIRNSAGQTFLHVLGEHWFHLPDLNCLCQLLDTLVGMSRDEKFDIGSRDHYGRTFLHMLFSVELPDSARRFVLERYGVITRATRDAFGIHPIISTPGPLSQVMDTDSPGTLSALGEDKIKDSYLLQIAREARDSPSVEDDEGRNGLHCLAMASLSTQSAMEKNNLSSSTNQGRNRRRTKSADDLLDSCSERLQFRYSLAEGLLTAGVDPNHYDNYGNTPLMAFCAELPEDDDYKTGPQIIEMLLNFGAEINARNHAGETALHIAVRCGRKLAVKVLVERGANVHARDAEGRSLLTLADVKMKGCMDDMPVNYCHFEACRAHLSGKGFAVQEPTVRDEWGVKD